MLKDIQPDLAAVFWDEGLPAKRMALQPEYKQQREAMPEQMIPQLDFIREFCAPMGFTSIAKPDTEADDLMACYTISAGVQNIHMVVTTNNTTSLQSVNAFVKCKFT